MKTQSTNFFSAISNAQMMSLTAEVKETIAFDFAQRNPKILSAADVWNIQRNKRSRVQRRFSF
ncbi:MAG: hypothetical protein ABJB86_20760 [Bacteroidota bacterium]